MSCYEHLLMTELTHHRVVQIKNTHNGARFIFVSSSFLWLGSIVTRLVARINIYMRQALGHACGKLFPKSKYIPYNLALSSNEILQEKMTRALPNHINLPENMI